MATRHGAHPLHGTYVENTGAQTSATHPPAFSTGPHVAQTSATHPPASSRPTRSGGIRSRAALGFGQTRSIGREPSRSPSASLISPFDGGMGCVSHCNGIGPVTRTRTRTPIRHALLDSTVEGAKVFALSFNMETSVAFVWAMVCTRLCKFKQGGAEFGHKTFASIARPWQWQNQADRAPPGFGPSLGQAAA